MQIINISPGSMGYPIHEMDKKYGCAITLYRNDDGSEQLFFSGASTDWCMYPLAMIDKRDK